MRVFIDFEASSLGKTSYPIEVAWVFEEGREQSYLIRPPERWTDWDPAAEAVHGIARATIERDGTPHDVVARRMVEALSGHDLFASAPSWDGKWLSALLRAAKLPRHALRLRDTDEAQRDGAAEILAPVVPREALGSVVEEVVRSATPDGDPEPPAHRALADARAELAAYRRVCAVARDRAAR
ncbi:transcriptional regulator [Sphingomonas beigongshangi]|uniref:transcriptional regulator n=1 Tax=Sphingomonas beigongshangi TaxID=2782540 RepID=UPI00193C3C6A|nr:transcriptional regulator [Sphingomonas beigongshangi]